MQFAERDTYIGFLELSLPLVALIIWGHRLLGQACWFFVDNNGAGFALAKGLSGDRDFDALLSSFWGVSAVLWSDTLDRAGGFLQQPC